MKQSICRQAGIQFFFKEKYGIWIVVLWKDPDVKGFAGHIILRQKQLCIGDPRKHRIESMPNKSCSLQKFRKLRFRISSALHLPVLPIKQVCIVLYTVIIFAAENILIPTKIADSQPVVDCQ